MDAVLITVCIALGACTGVLGFIGFLVWWMTHQMGH